jgi:hypothetical protein
MPLNHFICHFMIRHGSYAVWAFCALHMLHRWGWGTAVHFVVMATTEKFQIMCGILSFWRDETGHGQHKAVGAHKEALNADSKIGMKRKSDGLIKKP